MNYGEEQKNELEALSEIYFNEIKVINRDGPIAFSIKIRPQASSYDEQNDNLNTSNDNNDEEDDEGDYDDDEYDVDEDDDSGEDEDEQLEKRSKSQNVFVQLRFDLPEKYPDEKPSIQILDSSELQPAELSRLMEKLDQKAEESLGTVMVFILVSDVIEWLIHKTDEEAQEIQQEIDKKQKEIEAEEQKRFEGTIVTESTFLAWKARFDAEMLRSNLVKQKEQVDTSSNARRLTGREMFESDKTLAESDLNFVEDLDQNQLEALLHDLKEAELSDTDDIDLEEEELSAEEYDLEDEEEYSDDETATTTQKVKSKR